MPEPIDESAAVVAWLRAEVARWLPLNPHTDLGLSARSGAALLARLDAAEQGRTRAIANQERWLEAAETESIARRAAEAEVARLRAALATVAEYMEARSNDDRLRALVHLGRAWLALPPDLRAALAPAE